MKCRFLLVLAASFPLAGVGAGETVPVAAQSPGAAVTVQERSLRVGERDRTYLLVAPVAPAGKRALVIVLHGSSGTGKNMRDATGERFDRLAEQEGFLVAYPDAVGGNWYDCRASSAWRRDVDDVGFLRAIVQSAVTELAVDPARVYLFGYSGGGHMAMRYAWEAPDGVGGIAAVAANLPTAESLDCRMPEHGTRVMLVLGTADYTNPYAGGPHGAGGFVLSARKSAEAFAARLGLGSPEAEQVVHSASAGDPTSVQRLAWRRGGRPMVALYTVRDGGHTIPQPVYEFGPMMGATSRFDAPAAAWDFFVGR